MELADRLGGDPLNPHGNHGIGIWLQALFVETTHILGRDTLNLEGDQLINREFPETCSLHRLDVGTARDRLRPGLRLCGRWFFLGIWGGGGCGLCWGLS